MNKYGGGIQAARFGNAEHELSDQQRMMLQMQMEMEEMDSYGDEEYGDYDEEMEGVVASGDTEGGVLYMDGNQQVYANA